MRWFRSTVEGAGLSRFGPAVVLFGIVCASFSAGLVVIQVFRVPALGAFVCLGIFALQLESLAGLARVRRRELAKLWPEVIDSIHSAVSSGMTLIDAIEQLSSLGPIRLRGNFATLSHRVDSGWNFESALGELKNELGEVHADRLCELLLLVSSAGSDSLLHTLRQQSKNLRRDIAQASQIESKQGWVSGTAKIAVAAPWIVVALLSARSENAAVYNTSSGAVILLLGFLVSVFAYRLVHFMGALPEQPRIFLS